MGDNRWDVVMGPIWAEPTEWSQEMGQDAEEPAAWAQCPIDVHYCATDLHDPKHAAHIEHLPNVRLFDWPCVGHATGRYLKEAGVLDDVVRGSVVRL